MESKRVLSTALILCLLFCFAVGCGQGNGGASGTTPASGGAAGGAPTKITLGSTDRFITDPINYLDTKFMQDVQALANVEIDMTHYDEEKFNLLLASRDLPDFVFSTLGKKIDDVINGGLAMDIGPLLEEHAPNMLLPIYTQQNAMIRALKGGQDGAMYFIGDGVGYEYVRGNKVNTRGYNIRWDYYLEIGAPEITDDDAYLSALKQIQSAHPQTEDNKPVYATGLYDNLSAWRTRGSFTKPSLVNIWTFAGTMYMAGWDDNVLYNGYSDTYRSAFWLDMGFYNKMYNMGMLDPDSFTQTSDELAAKMKAGQYLASMGYASADLYNTMVLEDPQTLAGIMQIPSANALAFTDYFLPAGNFPSYFHFISKDSPNAEAVLRFYNVLHDYDIQRRLHSGEEGVHWDYVDGVPVMREETVAMFAENDPKLRELGIAVIPGLTRMLMGTATHPDGYLVDLMDTDEMRASSLTPIEKNMSDHYGILYPGQATYILSQEGKAVNMSNAKGEQIALALEVIPSDIARIIEKCNDILYRAIPNLVMAKTQAEFDTVQQQVFKDLEAAGEATAWAWCQEAYQKARDIIEPHLVSNPAAQ